MDTLLLVEDDRFTRHYIREQLEPHDILVLEAMTAKRSLEILRQHPVDVILLDLGLPDGNGLDIINDIRSYSDVPLIIVSSDESETSRITGLERGADDFLHKPVSARELLARIHANLRRYRRMPQHATVLSPIAGGNDNKIKFGEWLLDSAKFQIFDKNGNSGNLTNREFKVLKILIENAGHAITREELSAAASEGNYIPTPRAIDVKITRIRKKIGDHADTPDMIKTVRSVGYMFEFGTLNTVQKTAK